MATIIGYLRVSTKGQGESGLGLDAQRAAVETYAKQAGATLATTYAVLVCVVLAQPTENTSPEQGVTCPPDVKGEPPTVGGGSSGPLSDKLARSKGVICPPAGIDRDMQVTPPGGGHLKVIPPPGTPGGDQNVQPK